MRKNESIDDSLFQNILVKNLHTKYKKIILNKFSILDKLDLNSYLFLYKYYSQIPEKFYTEEIFNLFLEVLHTFASKDSNYSNMLENFEKEIDIAFSTILEINNLDFHNKSLPTNKAEMQLLCSQSYNPSYLQLVESVYASLIKILAYISRTNRNASTDGLDIFNCIQELAGNNLNIFTNSYNHTVRNGIGHGHIEYNFSEIIYTDKRGNSQNLTYEELIEIYNNLLDCCNAMILALKFFYLEHISEISIPNSMMLEILQAETRNPWWHIKTCLISEREDNYKQLNLFIDVNTIDYFKVYYSSYQTAILAEKLFPYYDYYFLSFNSNIAYSGYAMFIGKELEKIKNMKQKTTSDYSSVLQDDMVFYSTKITYPNFFNKIETFWYSGKIHLPIAFQDFKKEVGYINFHIRNVKIHRRSFFLIITGDIVLDNLDEIEQNNIQNILKQQVKRIGTIAYRDTKKPLYFLIFPIGYMKLRIFQKDYRVSKLQNYGLGSDLIGTIERNWFSKVNTVDIYGSIVEVYKKYRFAWNINWLKQ